MSKQELINDIKVGAYEYAEANATNEEEKRDLFYSIIQEAIEHVLNKKEVA